MMNQQQAGPVQPGPVPMSFAMQRAQLTDGTELVAVTVFSPTGQHVMFFSPEGADALAAQLSDLAAQVRSGLIVAGGLEGLRRA